MYICPVCGYDKLRRPPEDFLICPSCGTQFEYHDAVRSHAELRREWMAKGMKWHSISIPEPTNWSPYTQVTTVMFKTHNPRSVSQDSGIKVITSKSNRFVHNPSKGVFTYGYWNIIENVGETKLAHA